jgi:uncharacterized repeat protein (TIGR01451 family)
VRNQAQAQGRSTRGRWQAIPLRLLLAGLIVLSCATELFAWPTDSQWLPVPKGGNAIQDPQSDAQGSRNVVPDDGSTPAAYTYNDGINLYFRFRLDDDPTGTGGQGLLQPYGWGFEIDTDQNADDYEWLMMLNGISSPEVVRLMENTVKSGLGDPSDTAEDVISPYPLAGNYRITAADTCFDSGKNPGGVCNAANQYQDYFLDYKLPYSVFKAATGITDQSLIRYFIGSSSSANNLTENGADLVAGSDLYQMASDYVTPFGNLPTGMTFYDGGVRFVDDLNGAFERNVASPGDDLFIRIDDLDLNNQTNPSGTIVVTLTSPTGDSERVTLYATGVAGKFTGTLPTSGAGNSTGTLYILSGQTATVTYTEAVAADRSQNVAHTDTLLFTSNGTDIAIAKSVDKANRSIGQPVSYTITATNLGPSAVTSLTVNDLLPAGLSYTGSSATLGSYNNISGNWLISSNLAAGATASLTINATVAAGASGTLSNTASLAASTPTDRFTGNNSASVDVFIGGTDILITKDVSLEVPVSGDTVTFTVRAINLGPTGTSSVAVDDLLPAGLSFISATASQGSYNSGSGVWSIGTLNSGGGAQLSMDVLVSGANGQILTNTAALSGTSQPDINSANNSASASVLIGYTDLSIAKVARKLSPPLGSAGTAIAANTNNTVEFTVTLTNNGPHTATNITANDLTPSGMTFLSAAPSSGSYSSSTGDWTIASLAAGASTTLVIQVRVNSGTAGQVLSNQASITAVDQPDSNPGDESATATVTVNGTDFQVTKTASNTTPAAGQNVTWTITIVNNGPNPATGIVVTDLLPAGVSYVSDTPSVGSFASSGKAAGQWSGFALNNFPNVPYSATLQIVSSVDAGTAGQTITNNAFFTSAGIADADESNNVGSAFIAVAGTDLRITKTATPGYPGIGDTVSYTLTVFNDGPNSASGVIVNDLLPAEMSYASHSGGSYDPASGIWSVGNLANGASSQLTIQATVRNESNLLLITNTATVSAPAVGDPDPTNNIASADLHVGASDIAISKTVSNATPAPGSTIDYSVTATNLSSNPATGIEVQDLLPAGVTYSSHSASQGAYAFGLWVVGDLDASGGVTDSATLTITATVDAPTAALPIGSTISNTANLDRLDQVDTDSSNDSASVDIVTTLSGDLSTSTKSVTDLNGGDVLFGDTLRYTITLIESAGSTAQNVRVTDNVPANVGSFSVVSIPGGATDSSTTAGTGANGNGYLDISGITVPASGSVSIIFDVQVSGPNGGQIANTATIDNPGGIGGTATAPSLTIAAGSVPATGSKQLYLQAPTSDPFSTPQSLSRTPLTAYPAIVRGRISRSTPAVRWDMTPLLQSDLTLNANAGVVLQLDDSGSGSLHHLQLTLSYDPGGGPLVLAQQDFTNLDIADFVPQAYTFAMTTPAVTIPAGSTIQLTIDNEPDNAGGSSIYIAPFSSFTGTPDTSRVVLDSATVINVDSIGSFSDIAYPGGAALSGAGPGDTVRIRSTISDPFGSYDISSATLTISDPLGSVTVNQAAMTEVFDSAAATKVYEYRYTVPAAGPTGNWDVRVDALEGTEGTVSDFGLSSLTVANLPSLLLLKSSRVDADPINGSTNPKAVPGADIIYTLKVTNFGSGAAEKLVFTDPIPVNTKLYVGDLGQGTPVFFIDGAVASGFVAADLSVTYSANADCADYTYDPLPTADADGYNTDVCNVRITMDPIKSLPGGNAEFNLEFKVRLE